MRYKLELLFDSDNENTVDELEAIILRVSPYMVDNVDVLTIKVIS